MKYSELKRLVKEAQDIKEQFKKRVIELERALAMKSLVNRGDRAKCDHYTARKPWQPCPHPECTGDRDVVVVGVLPGENFSRSIDSIKPDEHTLIHRDLQIFYLRRTFFLDATNATMWAWYPSRDYTK